MFLLSRLRVGWPLLATAAAVGLGAGLRLIWGEDIEFKADERWTFARSQGTVPPGCDRWLGMPSSKAILNPGLSAWVFVFLAKLFAAADPVGLARAVQLCNVAALIALLAFAWRGVPLAERETWLWATALAALNPLAVLFQRKIWPPSVLPLVLVILLLGWSRRQRCGGAFLWGLLGVLCGQIHMAGFFFAAALAGWALLLDRHRVAWRGWLLGSMLGCLPMLPWLHYLVTSAGAGSRFNWQFHRLVEMKFWTHWATEPLGLGLSYALAGDYADFLRYPFLGGEPTYGAAGLTAVLAIAGIVLAVRAARWLWQERGRWRERLTGQGSPTDFTLAAAWWGYGTLLALSGLPFYRHYLVIAFPLLYVWLARLALLPAGIRLGRATLGVLCVAQFLLTVHFLSYIHANGGSVRGDYGPAYRAQQCAQVFSPTLSEPR